MLGKHVDYGGGRSLLAAVDRGIHIIARPRDDNLVHLTDARSRLTLSTALDPHLAATPGRWTDYPISVLRRLSRDFGGRLCGMDAVLASSLPSAAGLSSSSAVVIATFLPLAHFNDLARRASWQDHLTAPGALPGYLGAIENGLAFGPFAADFGVGTLGGSQDHTAILASRADRIAQYRFLPVGCEGDVAMPSDWCFVIATSGVSAPKTAGAKARYNDLSSDMARIISCWNRHGDNPVTSLLDALDGADDVLDRLEHHLASESGGSHLIARLHQFHEETRVIIPSVFTALAQRDATRLGLMVDRSEHLAETVLHNQVAETIFLARSARELGAMAASAFGAGFGGSVYAVVTRSAAEAFREAWQAGYQQRYAERTSRAEFFISPAAAGARRLDPA